MSENCCEDGRRYRDYIGDAEPGPFMACPCPEASLLRDILSGAVPAADTPAWRVLAGLIEAHAHARAIDMVKLEPPMPVEPSQLMKDRYPPSGHVHRADCTWTECAADCKRGRSAA